MATPQIAYVLFLFFYKCATENTVPPHKMPESEQIIDFDIKSHLANLNVMLACKNRDEFCKTTGINVLLCAVREMNSTRVYKDFNNSCYLFMSNMCDNPGEEFHIISSGTCGEYVASRRQEEHVAETIGINTAMTNATISGNGRKRNRRKHKTTTQAILRERTSTERSTLYPVRYAYDYHRCPKSCPNIYSPECVNVNRGHGKYFKFFEFVNHCTGDKFYCIHPGEFQPPPDYNDLIVHPSLLSWSHCAKAKYLQFARFTEAASSLGRYGWIPLNYSTTHILEPHERVPDYG